MVLFLDFWLCWVLLLPGLFSSCNKWVHSSLRCSSFSLWGYSFVFFCGVQALVVLAPGLWSTGSIVVGTGLVAPQHVGSSWTRDQTCVPCIGRRITYHWATREAWNIHLKHCTTRKVLKLSFNWEKIANKHGNVPASLMYETVFQIHKKKRTNTG